MIHGSCKFTSIKSEFRQSWIDERLDFSLVNTAGSNKQLKPDEKFNIHSSVVKSLWRPDVYFNEARKGHRFDISTENLALDIQV